ncbi:N-acetyltransferase family protein [Sporosarcina sp. OR05]|uniref:GNAT family N-acetyltransferase n=1 Tax=Sporosarcina sp. OR05 TaxID=2969819 RepID=UPI00352A34B6
MKIRHAQPIDAERIVELIKHVENSSENMMFEAGERSISVEQFTKRIASFEESGSTILVAENDRDLVGYLMVNRGGAIRTHHSAYLVIGISSDYRGQGIGKALFSALDEWARNNHLHRLELTVLKTNQAAIALYEKSGFVREGVKKDSLYVNGQYIDEYYMAKIL